MYADYNDRTNQTLVHILGSFLGQFLTTSRNPIPDKVVQKLMDLQDQRKNTGIEDNLELLGTLLQQLKHAFICIDAIDELEPKVRRQLFPVLKKLSPNNTRIFLTGRGHSENEVDKHFRVAQECIITISASHQDIREFVRQQIQDDDDIEAIDEALAKDIEDAIVGKSQGMYVTEYKG